MPPRSKGSRSGEGGTSMLLLGVSRPLCTPCSYGETCGMTPHCAWRGFSWAQIQWPAVSIHSE